jgi:hypothetical protein
MTKPIWCGREGMLYRERVWLQTGLDVRQTTGAAIGKPGRARGEYVPTAVVPRPFRR